MSKSPLLIIDASGYLYASYHAIQNMTNRKGESTNALFGFVNSVNKILSSFETPHIVVVFDGPDNTQVRKALYQHYKATRKETPQDLPMQIAWAKEYCQLKGLPSVEIPGVEADDTMGTIALWAASKSYEVLICTSDKDMCQIVNDKIKLVNTRKDNKIIDVNAVEEIHGVPPHQITDYLAIIGDTSDNVPGMPGFGPKTAAALLKEFGSLENIIQHPEKISGAKKQETVRENRDNALLSKKLVTLDTDIPFERPSVMYTLTDGLVEELKEFYLNVDFHSQLRALGATPTTQKSDIQEEYQLVDDEHSFKELIDKLHASKEVCFDCETTHEDPLKAELVGIGFGIKPGQAWYVPANGKLGKEKLMQGLKKIFDHTQTSFFGHNIKFDCQALENDGIHVKNVSFDTLLASYLLNAHQRQHSLDSLTFLYFGKQKIAISDLIGKGKSEISMDKVPIDKVCLYCCEDVDYTFRLKEILEKQLEERNLTKLLIELELPLMRVLERMERHGIYLDCDELAKFAKELNHQINHLTHEIQNLAGEPFNLNSPQQLGKILTTLGVKTQKKTTTGMSTRADELEKIRHAHPIVDLMLEYRSLEKLRSTYVEALPTQVNSKTHRIHCNFNQSVAATGRLSSQDPNLQNIPVRSEQGLRIREAFKPQKNGWSFLSADYSQIELRLLAHLCQDPNLIAAFERGEDIHRRTAAEVLQIPLEKVTDQDRYSAKAVNFGILYGQQAYGLSQNLGISTKEADAFIHTYFEHFPCVKGYIEASKAQARKTGKTVTLSGRERVIPEINSRNVQIRSAAERLAINTPLQGTAADIIKLAMLHIDAQLKQHHLAAYMILQIHDELIFEVPDEEIAKLTPLVKQAMENVMTLRVPLEVNISIGKNWKEC